MRRLAAAIALLLALPALASPHAGAAASCDATCWDMRLFPTLPEGIVSTMKLSPLPGDASPEAVGSHSTEFDASTVPLPSALTLGAGGRVLVHLDNRTAALPGSYTTRVEIHRVDGSLDTLLVTEEFTASVVGTPSRTPFAPAPARDATDPTRGVVENFIDLSFTLDQSLSFAPGEELRVVVHPICVAVCTAPFELGRQDAPTSISLPVLEGPDAGELHPRANAVAPGVHSGEVPDAYAADDAVFDAVPGERIALTGASLFDPHGVQRDAYTVADLGGKWLIRATVFSQIQENLSGNTTLVVPIRNSAAVAETHPNHPTDTSFTYTFDLYVEPARNEDDAGLRADAPGTSFALLPGSGHYQGNVTPFDNADSYVVQVPRARSIDIWLRPSTGLAATLTDNAEWNNPVGIPTGLSHIRDEAVFAPLSQNFTVVRNGGQGSYELDIVISQEANLTGAPSATMIAGGSYQSLSGSSDGVLAWAPNATASRGDLFRLTPAGREFLRPSPDRFVAAANRTLLVSSFDQSLLLERDDGGDPVPYLNESIPITFLKDGSLLRLIPSNSQAKSQAYITRTSLDGQETLVTVDLPSEFRIGPDGRLRPIDRGFYEARALDVDTGIWAEEWIAPFLQSDITFDVTGRAYGVSRFPLPNGSTQPVVVRYDPAIPGPFDVIATLPSLPLQYSLAAAKEGVYVGSDAGAFYVPLDTPGFPGFLPELHARPAADLVVDDFSVLNDSLMAGVPDVVTDGHTFHFRVSNQGQGAVTNPFWIVLSDNSRGAFSYTQSFKVDRVLEPGDEWVIEIHEAGKLSPGTHFTQVFVDSEQEIVESNETNNQLTTWYSWDDRAPTPI